MRATFGAMRSPTLLLLALVAFRCGAPAGNPSAEGAPGAVSEVTDAALRPDWPGYYEDTLSCYGCEGVVTQLWVRSDSTFILRERYLGIDSVARGSIGRWHVVVPDVEGAAPLMTIGTGTDKPDFWRYDEPGLIRVDEMGNDLNDEGGQSLDKLANEVADEVPRMRLMGTLTILADAKRFAPCGSGRSWPCMAGLDLGAEEGELIASMTGMELERAYQAAVRAPGAPWPVMAECSLGLGPAAEGDGAEEHIVIHRLIAAGEPCP
jgi:uncharacterized lipoprotein NlpE involved in copper resistance